MPSGHKLVTLRDAAQWPGAVTAVARITTTVAVLVDQSAA
jgi:hypothetical protein